jgi:hypothetical protein
VQSSDASCWTLDCYHIKYIMSIVHHAPGAGLLASCEAIKGREETHNSGLDTDVLDRCKQLAHLVKALGLLPKGPGFEPDHASTHIMYLLSPPLAV